MSALSMVLAMLLATQDTVPPGYGTLKRDDIVVRFTTGTVEIQFLPLDEQVIRLLATDTYRSVARRRMTCSSRGRNWISTVPVVNRTTMSSRFRVPYPGGTVSWVASSIANTILSAD